MTLFTGLKTDDSIEYTLGNFEKVKKGLLDNKNDLLPELVHKAGRSDIANHLEELLGTNGPLTAVWELRVPESAALVARHIVEAAGGVVPPAVLGRKPFVLFAAPQFGFYHTGLPTYPLTHYTVRLLWSRRVAVALLADFQGFWPWKLAQYRRWILGVMLDLRTWKPGEFMGHDRLYVGFESAQDFYGVSPGLWSTGYLFEGHEPWLAHVEAKMLFDAGKPKNPREACYAVSEWMVRKRFVHGYLQWYDHCAGGPPPPNADPKTGGIGVATPTSLATLKDVIDFKWGGCWVNSTYMAKVLNAMNVPAVAVRGTRTAAGDLASGAWSYTGFAGGGLHLTVYALGADLALIHGDDCLVDAGQVCVLPPPKVVWRPARATWWAHACLGSPKPVPGKNPSVDDKTWVAHCGKQMLQELRAAANVMTERPELKLFANAKWDALGNITPSDRQVFADALDLLSWGCAVPPSLHWLASDEPWADHVSWSKTPRNRPVELTQWQVAVKQGKAAAKPTFTKLPGVAGAPATIPEPGLSEYLARHGRIALQGVPLQPNDVPIRLRHVELVALLPPAVKQLTAPAKLDAQVQNSWAVRVLVLAVRLRGLTLGTDAFQSVLDQLREAAKETEKLQDRRSVAFPDDRSLQFAGDNKLATATLEPADPLVRGEYFGALRGRKCNPSQDHYGEASSAEGVAAAVRFAVRAVAWYLTQKQPEAW